jgi:hypothetical protein
LIIDPAGDKRRQSQTSELGSEIEAVSDPQPEAEVPLVQAFPLFDNVYVLAVKKQGRDADEDREMKQLLNSDEVDRFDLPQSDHMYAVALEFVSNHVRRVRSGRSISTRKRQFDDTTLVISGKAIPRLPLRFVKIRWAIERGAAVDLMGRRVFRPRLSRIDMPGRSFIWAPGSGDSFDLAYVLANVCAILRLHIPDPLAAVGDVGLRNNEVAGGHFEIEQKRGTARAQGIRNLIISARSGFMPGDHLGVRYWPVNDVDEAVFSMLAASLQPDRPLMR